MVFSAKISKFGKGSNLSLYMPSENLIEIYYFDGGIGKKSVSIDGDTLSLSKSGLSLGYEEVIALGSGLFVSRIAKSLGVIKYE